MKRPTSLLALAALASCAPSPIAPEPVDIREVAVNGAIPSVPPDPWAMHLARSVAPGPAPSGDNALFEREEIGRRALIVRNRDYADAIQGYLMERGIEAQSIDGSGHLLRMGASIRLASLGYTLEHIKLLEAAGVRIVDAAIAAERGQGKLDEQLVLAPSVAIVEAVEAPVRIDLGDGFATSQTVRVVERLKGGPAAGTELILRQGDLATAKPAQARLFSLDPGERQLAFLSNDAYRHWTLTRGDPPALDKRIVVHLGPPRDIVADRLVPLGTEAALPLATLRARLAVLDAAEVRARRRIQASVPRQGTDGMWLIDRINGREALPWRYWLRVSGGAAEGGRDGCNWWGRQLHQGKRIVISTAMGCGKDPATTIYQKVLTGEPPARGEHLADGGLRFALGGDEMIFRRPLD